MRILIVDDEPPARARLRTLLEFLPDADALEIVGEAEDGEVALERIAELAPDLVFLDVQMPGLDGFAVLRALAADTGPDESLPLVIFATAYDQHAIRAFDVHAVDYLVKPFDVPRLATAIGRARERLAARRAPRAGAATEADAAGALAPELVALLAAVRGGATTARAYLTRIPVRSGDRLFYVRTADLDWVEADGNYLRLHTSAAAGPARAPLIRKTLGALAEALDPAQFARVHRSALVNLDRIRELRALPDGEFQLLLTTGAKLKVSRTYRANLPGI